MGLSKLTHFCALFLLVALIFNGVNSVAVNSGESKQAIIAKEDLSESDKSSIPIELDEESSKSGYHPPACYKKIAKCTTKKECRRQPCGCNIVQVPCKCSLKPYQTTCCKLETRQEQCNCKKENFKCNCSEQTFQCGCKIVPCECNCAYRPYQCRCKKVSYLCHNSYRFGSHSHANYKPKYCVKTVCGTCHKKVCATCYRKQCRTCKKTVCKTCSRNKCETCNKKVRVCKKCTKTKRVCQNCPERKCKTCMKCYNKPAGCKYFYVKCTDIVSHH